MRIEELQLERFGHFSGHSLDFSGKDILVHLIYGPNETGKSTALAAICDLMFGIPERTPYSFLHEYGRLRIGGTLTNSAGQRLSFKRRKARANTLLRLDESGELPKTALVPFLGSISRELFERMFGLNYQRLRSGGQNMVRSGGELAKNLFEAGSGTLGVASVAAALSTEADSIGSPSRRSGSKPYWRSYDRYEEAMDRVRAESLKAEAWNAAVTALDDAIERRKKLDTALAERRQERSRVERVRRVVPLLRRLDDVRAEQESLLGGPLFSDGFENRWREFVQALAAARESVRANTETLTTFAQFPDEIPPQSIVGLVNKLEFRFRHGVGWLQTKIKWTTSSSPSIKIFLKAHVPLQPTLKWCMSRHPGSLIARVRLSWLGEVRLMSAIGTEETIHLSRQIVGLLGRSRPSRASLRAPQLASSCRSAMSAYRRPSGQSGP